MPRTGGLPQRGGTPATALCDLLCVTCHGRAVCHRWTSSIGTASRCRVPPLERVCLCLVVCSGLPRGATGTAVPAVDSCSTVSAAGTSETLIKLTSRCCYRIGFRSVTWPEGMGWMPDKSVNPTLIYDNFLEDGAVGRDLPCLFALDVILCYAMPAGTPSRHVQTRGLISVCCVLSAATPPRSGRVSLPYTIRCHKTSGRAPAARRRSCGDLRFIRPSHHWRHFVCHRRPMGSSLSPLKRAG